MADSERAWQYSRNHSAVLPSEPAFRRKVPDSVPQKGASQLLLFIHIGYRAYHFNEIIAIV